MNSEPNFNEEITLKALRENLGLTQGELGNRLGLSYRTIAEWEAGRQIPRLDNAIALAKELGVSIITLAKALRIDVSGLPDEEIPNRWPEA
jgi:transcriptional regulator with XRE-family HTH domain